MGRDREVLRQSLETKTREQLLVEMDTKWRERVLEVYGKREEEFGGDEEAYNDYVEKREDLSKCSPSPLRPFLSPFLTFSPSLPLPLLPVYTLANRLFLDENEVKQAETRLENERKLNAAAVAKYKARREGTYVRMYVCR